MVILSYCANCTNIFIKVLSTARGKTTLVHDCDIVIKMSHFHDGVILLQVVEFISFSFSNSNFVIPVDSKEQKL